MTKTINAVAGITFVLLLAGIFAASAYADVTLRDRGTTGRTVVTVPAPLPSPPPLPTPPPPSGGITSSTNGSIDTGGNQGGTVTTGDGHVSVHEVNIGPTNPPPQNVDSSTGGQVSAPPPPPCSTDRRAPNQCPIQSPPRTR